MSKSLTVSEAREGFADTVNRVAYTKERIILHRRGKELAAVVPIEDLKALEALEEERRSLSRSRVDQLVRMDDEAGLYARELEKARQANR